jgi:hypothetical protein
LLAVLEGAQQQAHAYVVDRTAELEQPTLVVVGADHRGHIERQQPLEQRPADGPAHTRYEHLPAAQECR